MSSHMVFRKITKIISAAVILGYVVILFIMPITPETEGWYATLPKNEEYYFLFDNIGTESKIAIDIVFSREGDYSVKILEQSQIFSYTRDELLPSDLFFSQNVSQDNSIHFTTTLQEDYYALFIANYNYVESDVRILIDSPEWDSFSEEGFLMAITLIFSLSLIPISGIIVTRHILFLQHLYGEQDYSFMMKILFSLFRVKKLEKSE